MFFVDDNEPQSFVTEELLIQESSKRFCLFIGGTSQDRNKIKHIITALNEYYDDNVIGAGSVLSREFKKTPSIKEKHEQLAQTCIEQLKADKTVTIIGYSFGSVEITAVVENIRKQLSNDFQSHANKIEVVMISPPGFSQEVTKFKRINQAIHVSKRILDLGKSLTPISGEHYAVESLAYFPISGISSNDISEHLRNAYPQLTRGNMSTNKNLDFDVMVPRHDLSELLDDETKIQIKELDSKILAAAETAKLSGNWNEFKNLMKLRGQLVIKNIRQLTKVDAIEKSLDLPETTGWMWGGALEVLRLFLDVLKTKPQKLMNELLSQGVICKVLVPEFESLLSVSDFSETYLLESLTHVSAIAIPGVLIQALQMLHQ